MEKFATILAAGMLGSAAFAVDVDINIGTRPTRPPRVITVEPRPEVERVWIPEQIVQRTERIQDPPRTERTIERVLVQPARVIKKEEQVLVSPARIEKVRETVVVRPAQVSREWVPAVTESVRVGPVKVQRTVAEGYFREVTIPAEISTVFRDVEIPARFETRYREIEIPAKYEDVPRVVEIPGRFREVVRNEVIPGRWEERVIQPQPRTVIIEQPRRSSSLLDIDIDLSKKKKRHDRD